MNQWRQLDGKVPLQDIAKATDRNITTVQSLVQQGAIKTENVVFPGSAHAMTAIAVGDVDKLLEMIARSVRYGTRQKKPKLMREEAEAQSARRALKSITERKPEPEVENGSYAEFEATLRRARILAKKHNVSEAHLVDDKWEISRLISTTISL